MSSIKAPPVRKLAAVQLLVVFGLSSAALLFLGWISAYSVLIGGLINMIPNAYFAHKAFRYRGARAAQKIVRELYTGEAIKLLLMGAGFALSFLYVKPLNTAALFSGFVLVHITGILVFVRISTPPRNNP
jgi:ATP synthase protein I